MQMPKPRVLPQIMRPYRVHLNLHPATEGGLGQVSHLIQSGYYQDRPVWGVVWTLRGGFFWTPHTPPIHTLV